MPDSRTSYETERMIQQGSSLAALEERVKHLATSSDVKAVEAAMVERLTNLQLAMLDQFSQLSERLLNEDRVRVVIADELKPIQVSIEALPDENRMENVINSTNSAQRKFMWPLIITVLLSLASLGVAVTSLALSH